MSDAIIENPVINSPFEEPTRHFRFGDDGITKRPWNAGASAHTSCPSRSHGSTSRPAPVAETEWTASRIQENEFINRIRERVDLWRRGGYVGITKTTARLLDYWTAARTARDGCSSARSRRSRRPSTSPKSRASMATPGLRTIFARRNEDSNPDLLPHRLRRWRPAAARPS